MDRFFLVRGASGWYILHGVRLGQLRAASWGTQALVKDQRDTCFVLKVQVQQKCGIAAQQRLASSRGSVSLLLTSSFQQT